MYLYIFFSYISLYIIYFNESRDFMEKNEIIKSIGSRTNGEVYLGVVGAVRTGKSTFIKKFI